MDLEGGVLPFGCGCLLMSGFKHSAKRRRVFGTDAIWRVEADEKQ